MKRKSLALLCAILTLPAFCHGQTPAPVTSVEFGNDTAPRPAHPRQRVAQQRAKKSNVYSLRTGAVNVEGRWAGEVS